MRWFGALTFSFVWVLSASALVPQQMHYNGYLTNAVGEPVNCPDSVVCAESFELTFRLYNSEESDTPIWEESKIGVPFYGGSFHVSLGTEIPISAEVLSQPVWIGIKVNEHPEMLPRQKVQSAPYAIRAGTVTFADNAAQLGGMNPEEYATAESLTELENTLNGNDDDTLAGLVCAQGEVAKFFDGAWACQPDQVMSEAQIKAWADEVDDVGLTVESDPTVPANIKDGISWGELSEVPTELLDGDQVGITSESDPSVAATTSGKWCRGTGGTITCDQDEPSSGASVGECIFIDVAATGGNANCPADHPMMSGVRVHYIILNNGWMFHNNQSVKCCALQ